MSRGVRHGPARGAHGQQLQNGLPKGDPRSMVSFRPLRAFVLAVYTSEATGDGNASSLTQGQGARGIYVDLYVYGVRNGVVDRVLFPMPVGLHEGDVRLPRPAAFKVGGGNVPDFSKALITPEQVDADHVLLDFMEGSPWYPYVAGMLTHPKIDYGNEQLPLGVRMLPSAAEGQPRVLRHRGVSVTITDAGNVVVDTSRAHGSGRQPDAQELPANQASGQVDVTLMAGGRLRVWNGVATPEPLLSLQNGAAQAQLTLGSGGRHPAQAEELRTLYTELVGRFDALAQTVEGMARQLAGHIHPVTVVPAPAAGPSAELTSFATLQAPRAPDWNQAIENDRMAFPPRLA